LQKNTGQNGGKPKLDLNVGAAWAQGVTGKNVTTAIMDDGERYRHGGRGFESVHLFYIFRVQTNRPKINVFWSVHVEVGGFESRNRMFLFLFLPCKNGLVKLRKWLIKKYSVLKCLNLYVEIFTLVS
jgi:hypothetical protein